MIGTPVSFERRQRCAPYAAGRRAFGHGSTGLPAVRKILRAAIDMSGSSPRCRRAIGIYSGYYIANIRTGRPGSVRIRPDAEHDKQGGSMISRRRFTAAAAATIAAGPSIRRAGAQTKTIIRYCDVLPANYPSVVALVAAGRVIAAKTGGTPAKQHLPPLRLATHA